MDGGGGGPWCQSVPLEPLEDEVVAGVEDELDEDDDVDEPLDDEAVSDDEEDLRLSVR